MLTNVRQVKAIIFPIVIYRYESWAIKSWRIWPWALKKTWCFSTVMLEKTLESPLNCKEIKPGHPKGNQSWTFIRRTDAEAETLVFWPPDTKNWLIRKDPDAGKDWGQEEKGTAEDEMVGWYHRLNGHEFEQALGIGDGQGSLACCSLWSHKESDTTEWLNWIEFSYHILPCVCVCMCAQLCPTLFNSMDCSPPGSSLHGFSRQEYWSRLPFPSSGVFLTQGWNPGLLHCQLILYHLSPQKN